MVNKLKLLVRFFLIFSLLVAYGFLIFGIIMDSPKLPRYQVFIIAFLFNYLLSSAIGFYILRSKRYETFKTVWIFLFLFFPFLGLILFATFGISGLKRRSLKEYKQDLHSYAKYENYDFHNEILSDQNFQDLSFRYVAKVCPCPIYDKNIISILKNPKENLEAIVNLINKAEKFIHLEYYVISDGSVSDHLFELLKAKAKAGIEVRILVDALGIFNVLEKRKIKDLITAGVKFRIFNRFKGNPLSLWNYRCHKKCIVIDNKYAIYGSANISDEYFGISKYNFPTTDISFILEGPIVNSLNVLFAFDWKNYTPRKSGCRSVHSLFVDANKYFQIHYPHTSKATEVAQLLESGPDVNEKVIKNTLLQLIYSAKKKIVISTPYFLPTADLMNALKLASWSGVKIQIILPLKPDNSKVVLNMNRRHYLELFSCGIEVYEFFGFNHEKMMVVDDELVYTGTYNWDFRSLYINFETAIQIRSVKLAAEINEILMDQIKNSLRIDEARYAKIWTRKEKMKSLLIAIFHPLL